MKNATQSTTEKSTPKSILTDAATRIRQALDTWNATDLNSVTGARQLLEQAVEDLKQAGTALREAPPENAAELRKQLSALRRDVPRMCRLVDACSAFQNGLAVRLGHSVTYNHSGAVPVSGAVLSTGFEA